MKSSSDFFFRKPKSCRIKRDFEVIAHLGEGAFGYVIKVNIFLNFIYLFFLIYESFRKIPVEYFCLTIRTNIVKTAVLVFFTIIC